MDVESYQETIPFTPKHPSKIYFIFREQTFEHWPRQLAQTPKNLAANGFFYTGFGDRVTCFYCGITLKQWEKDECIEIEHTKWEPSCLFAKMVSDQLSHFDLYQCC